MLPQDEVARWTHDAAIKVNPASTTIGLTSEAPSRGSEKRCSFYRRRQKHKDNEEWQLEMQTLPTPKTLENTGKRANEGGGGDEPTTPKNVRAFGKAVHRSVPFGDWQLMEKVWGEFANHEERKCATQPAQLVVTSAPETILQSTEDEFGRIAVKDSHAIGSPPGKMKAQKPQTKQVV